MFSYSLFIFETNDNVFICSVKNSKEPIKTTTLFMSLFKFKSLMDK